MKPVKMPCYLRHALWQRLLSTFLACLMALPGNLLLPLVAQVGERDVPPAPLEAEVLELKLNYAIPVGDEVRVALSFRADTNHNYVIEYRDELTASSACAGWQVLPNAPHNFGIAFATNSGPSPQRLYRLLRYDTPFTGLHALLLNDTGTNRYDQVTSDPTLSGLVVPSEAGLTLQATLDDGDPVVLMPVKARQHFVLDRARLDSVYGGSLPDGPHLLHLQTTAPDGRVAQEFSLAFILDTLPPLLTLDLDVGSDTLPVGDFETTAEIVNLTGSTEPGLRVELLPAGLQTWADAGGHFHFPNVALSLGANPFTAITRDAQCNEAQINRVITRPVVPPDCPFLAGLEFWQTIISPPSPGGPAGSVTAHDCAVTLTEGGSFQVSLSGPVEIPAAPAILQITFETPVFDSSSLGFMRDAFEVALTDEQGRPLTYTIQGANGVSAASATTPDVLPPSPDACFNWSEGQPPSAAPGTALVPSSLAADPATLSVDVRHLPAGSLAYLRLRLVNNDADQASQVILRDLRFVAPETVPALAGQAIPALSVWGLSALGPRPHLTTDECASVPPLFSTSLDRNVPLIAPGRAFGLIPPGESFVVFTNKALFLDLAQAVDATGDFPDSGLISGGAAARQTVGSVTFSLSPPGSELYVGLEGGDWTDLLPGPDVAISDVENLNVDFDGLVTAAGFDLVEPTSGMCCPPHFPFTETEFEITLKRDTTVIGQLQYSPPNDQAAFIGVISAEPFNRMEIRDLSLGADDEYFGHFYASDSVHVAPTLVVVQPTADSTLPAGPHILTGQAIANISVSLSPNPATNGLETYFAEDVSPFPIDGQNTVPTPLYPKSQSAAQALRSRLNLPITESFEGFAAGEVPSILRFGVSSANVSGNRIVITQDDPSIAFEGVFAVSGINYLGLGLSADGEESFRLDFDTPQSAVGFFGVDIEVNRFELRIARPDGSVEVASVPVTVPQGSGGVFYFGIIDPQRPFTSLEFRNLGFRDDGFGFDDMTIATPEQVIEPLTANRIEIVTVDGQPVEALDASGNFFSTLEIRPGENRFEVAATDSFGLSTTNVLTVYGTTCPQTFASLGEVTASTTPQFGRTSFTDWTRTLYADVALHNSGSFPIRAPFYVGVTRISDPTVRVLGADGVSADGIPYYDYSPALAANPSPSPGAEGWGEGELAPGAATLFRSLAFHNPNRVPFTYELVVLGQVNQSPYFTSVPVLEAVVGRPYTYDARAVDPEGEAVSYRGLQLPLGAGFNEANGRLSWTPTESGTHTVQLQAEDPRGGIGEQRFLLAAINPPSNRPPVFVSRPITVAHVADSSYRSNRFDFSKWTPIQFDISSDPDGHWTTVSDTVVRQDGNSDPTIFLSDVAFSNVVITGSIQVATADDDDDLGFVFGYHDRSHFYSFEWGQGGENGTAGMRVLKYHADKAVETEAAVVLFANSIPWQDFTEYQCRLVLTTNHLSLTVYKGINVLQQIDLDEPGLTPGRFGFYDSSQDAATFRNFSYAPIASYKYPAHATDPDHDELTYSLIDGPAGMSVDPATGLVRWAFSPDWLSRETPDPDDPTLPVAPGFDIDVYANVIDPVFLSFDSIGDLFVGRDNSGSGGGPVDPVFIHRVQRRDRVVEEFGRVAIVDPDDVLVDQSGTLSGQPGSVLVGGVWRPDSSDGAIHAIRPDGTVELLFGPASIYGNVAGMLTDGSGRLLLHDSISDSIVIVKDGSAAVLSHLPVGAEQLAIHPHGDIYAGGADGKIYVLSPSGQLRDTVFAEGVEPWPKIAFGPGGYWGSDLYVLTSETGKLIRINEAGEMVVLVSGFKGGHDIMFGPDQAMYLSEFDNDRILRIRPSREAQGLTPDEALVTLAATDGRGGVAYQSYRICVLPAEGNRPPIIMSCPTIDVWPSQTLNHQVHAVDPDQDQLLYRLASGPTDLAINSTNGTLTWKSGTPPAGQYSATVSVVDSHGGMAEQEIFVRVLEGEATTISGVVFADLNRNGIREISTAFATNTSGNGDMWLAGMPDGSVASGTDVSPTSSPALAQGLSLTVGSTISFFVAGGVANGPAIAIHPPDGGEFTGHREGPENGISDIIAPVNAALGVFLGPDRPDVSPSPGALDFRPEGNVPGGIDYSILAPLLKQVFFFGDGVNSNGERQQVVVPPGATRLFLGTMDGFEWTNNYGNLTIQVVSGTEETGVIGQLVFVDLDHDGHRGLCEPWSLSASDGSYAIGNLLGDSFDVRCSPQVGWISSIGTDDQLRVIHNASGGVTSAHFGIIRDGGQIFEGDVGFVSWPFSTTIAVNQEFAFQVVALSVSNKQLEYNLVSAPEGMIVEPHTGVVAWRPVFFQLGMHDVVLRAVDGDGVSTLQFWQITVTVANTPPLITSFPPSPAVVGLPWQFTIRTQDAEGSPVLVSLAEGAPAGMRLDSVLVPALASSQAASRVAVLSWTPELSQVGTNPIRLRAVDAEGASTTQTFNVEVVPAAVNRPPAIISQPRREVRVGTPLAYLASAIDPDGDVLIFSLLESPPGLVLTHRIPEDLTGSDPDGADLTLLGQQLVLWTPAGDQLGSHRVRLRVSDGRGGEADQVFELVVSSTLENEAPSIVSTPPGAATAGQGYAVDLEARDPDNDPLMWRLLTGPPGMSLDPVLGTLRWTPTLDQLGTNRVVVEVSDAFQATASLAWEIDVGCANRSPQITSVPPTAAHTGAPYLYAARGQDPDGDPLTWSFDGAPPTGMTLNAQTGVLRWEPTSAQTGPNSVRIRVSDGRGGVGSQDYVVYVSDQRANHAPVITSAPARGATIGQPYAYLLRATDSDGDALAAQGLRLPAGATLVEGISVAGSLEAGVTWTPAAEQTGAQEFILAVRDTAGASVAQRFFVTVRANEPPTITSAPRTNATPEVTYRYAVVASDPNGDPLAYELVTGPAGMVVDGLGRVSWLPLATQLGPQPVRLAVQDGFGGEAVQEFVVHVAADTRPPSVALELVTGLISETGDWAAYLDSTVQVRVRATDDTAVANRSLQLGQRSLPLGADGLATFAPTAAGLFELVGTATDPAGNTGSAQRPLMVIDPHAENRVSVRILSPTNDASITHRVPIVATLTNDVALTRYRVEIAPVSEVNLGDIGAPNPAWTEIASGELPDHQTVYEAITVATFDPLTLLNDTYVARVYAEDIKFQGWYEPVILNVTGDLKFGEFRLEFTDLQVPLAGLPITVSRVYDTRESQRNGDFGYGWRLGLRDARIRETLKNGTMYLGSRVYLNAPDGRRIGFTTRIDSYAWFGFTFVKVGLQPDPGVYDRLEIIGNDAIYYQGLFLGGLGDENFNPSQYRLTTKDGTVYLYDDRQGLEQITDPNGNAVVYTRDGIFHYPSGANEPDQAIQFVRDPQGRITDIIDPDGKPLTYQYDGAGDLRAFTDQSGSSTRYGYDPQRAHFLKEIIDPFGKSALNLVYDETGKLSEVRDAAGRPVKQEFDDESNTGTFTDARGNQTIVRLDDRGNETARIIPGISTNYFAYDQNNNLTNAINARGYATNFTYDARGNVTSITDGLNNTTRITYNELSKPVEVINALGQKLNLRYDPAGQLLEVINNTGQVTRVARDSQGRITRLTDAANHTTRFEYEGGCACGRPGKVINPDGTFRLYEYNSLGQTNRVVNELGAETVFEYDPSGRLLAVQDALSNRVTYGYDGPRLVDVTDPLGRVTRYGYDDFGRTNSITDAEGGVVRFEYDANGNRTQVTDPVGNVTKFVYDAANRLTQQIDPLGHTNFFAYDAAGNRIEAIDRNGRRRTFAYDGLNRMTNEVWWEGTSVVKSIVFGFNELGVQTLAEDEVARYDYRYDALNRLERVLAQSSGVPDFTLLYTYTTLGQVESVTDNWGVRVGSSYDNRNLLARRTWQGPGVDPARVDFAYDLTGNRIQTDRYADLAGTQRIGWTTNTYNQAGIVTNITHLGPSGEALARYDYQFDAAYQIRQWTINGQLSAFDYDRTSQLTNAVNTAQPDESFRYDANGNRSGSQSGGSYVVGSNNQILSDGTHHYAYDFEGNMTSRSNTVTGVLTTYQWDHRNRLTSVLDYDAAGAVTQTVEFEYDAMNRRLAKTVNEETQRFLYNGDDSWVDLDGGNTITARYLHGARIDELVARQRVSDGRGWYLTDHLGTVRDIVSAAGAVVAHVEYSSFGQVISVIGPGVLDRFRFTGREFDEETRLYCYRARYYAASIGMFISQDPIGFDSRDLNLYHYAVNSPIMHLDPSGKTALLSYLAVNVIAGAVFGAISGAIFGPSIGQGAGRGAVIGFVAGFVIAFLVPTFALDAAIGGAIFTGALGTVLTPFTPYLDRFISIKLCEYGYCNVSSEFLSALREILVSILPIP